MYLKSAIYYDTYYHFIEYDSYSRKVHSIIQELYPNAKTLLEVACGTGKYLERLKNFYTVEGMDLNIEMLEIAKTRLGDIPLHQGNMINFTINKSFDVVICLFSSIVYVKTAANMHSAIDRMARHLNPGGVLIVEPWVSPQNYCLGKVISNYVDQSDIKIAWMYKQELEDNVSILDINYLVGTAEGVKYFTERHELGLFSNEEYIEAFNSVGMKADYDPVGLLKRGLFVGVKNA
jgi:ubiquinone/menaquinone biosynthesis C-methylase UbiE